MPTSLATVAIAVFITVVSSAITNCPAANVNNTSPAAPAAARPRRSPTLPSPQRSLARSNAALDGDPIVVGRAAECCVIGVVLVGVGDGEAFECAVERVLVAEVAADLRGVAGAGVSAARVAPQISPYSAKRDAGIPSTTADPFISRRWRT